MTNDNSLFLENNKNLKKILYNYLLVSKSIDILLNKPGKMLFLELIKTYYATDTETFKLHYNLLECNLKYKRGNLKAAFRELERHQLAFREPQPGSQDVFIRINLKQVEYYINLIIGKNENAS